MLAISRCFSALIAANPRFEPPELALFEPGIFFLLLNGCEIISRNARRAAPFTSLMEVKQLKSRAFQMSLRQGPNAAALIPQTSELACTSAGAAVARRNATAPSATADSKPIGTIVCSAMVRATSGANQTNASKVASQRSQPCR